MIKTLLTLLFATSLCSGQSWIWGAGGTTATDTTGLSNRIDAIYDRIPGAARDASFIIYKDGPTVKVWNCVDYQVDTSGTDPDDCFQYAFDNLPATGCKRRVIIDDFHDSVETVILPSDVRVDVLGELIAHPDMTRAVFINADSGSAHDIEICGGGRISGNPLGCLFNDVRTATIYMTGVVNNLHIHDLHITGPDSGTGAIHSGWGIYCYDCSNVRISNCTVDSSGYDNIIFWNSFGSITGNTIFGPTGVSGIQLAHSGSTSVCNNVIVGCKYGMRICHEETDYAIISGNTIIGMGNWDSYGIEVCDGADFMRVDGNTFENLYCAIYTRGMVYESTSYDNVFSGNNFGNIRTWFHADDNSCSGIKLWDNVVKNGVPTQAYRIFDIGSGNRDIRIERNEFIDFSADSVSDLGTDTYFSGNIGYPTERQGVHHFSSINSIYSFAHGLVGVPNSVQLTPMNLIAVDSVCVDSMDADSMWISFVTSASAGTNDVLFSIDIRILSSLSYDFMVLDTDTVYVGDVFSDSAKIDDVWLEDGGSSPIDGGAGNILNLGNWGNREVLYRWQTITDFPIADDIENVLSVTASIFVLTHDINGYAVCYGDTTAFVENQACDSIPYADGTWKAYVPTAALDSVQITIDDTLSRVEWDVTDAFTEGDATLTIHFIGRSPGVKCQFVAHEGCWDTSRLPQLKLVYTHWVAP